LEEKARASGCEIATTVDEAKLDDYCIHVRCCGFKMTDKDARDPLVVDESDPLKRGQLLFVLIVHYLPVHQPIIMRTQP
jgi:hypothetical protein